MESPKQVLSIKVSPILHQRLKKEVGSSKVVVKRILDEQVGKVVREQREFEKKSIADYQRSARSSALKKRKKSLRGSN
jgi:hypothetical protein